MRGLDEIVRAVAALMGIDAAQVARRQAFLELRDSDVAALCDLHRRLGAQRQGFVDRFYGHLLAFEETARILSDPARLERLKEVQRRYFERLTEGRYDWDYALERLRVGVAHHRVGLDLTWYLGAYRLYLDWLLPVIWAAYPGDPKRALEAFSAALKVISFDLGLAVEAYLHAERRALLAAKAFTDQIVASLPLGLLVLDGGLDVVAANAAFCEEFGQSEAQVLGRPLSEVLPLSGLRERALEVLSSGVAARALPFVHLLPGGSRPIEVSLARIDLPDTAPQLLLLVEDRSEAEALRAQARTAELRFREVVESASDGIVIMDEDERITYFNAAAERIFGYRRDEVIGRPVSLLMPEAYRSGHGEAVAHDRARAEPSGPTHLRRIEGLRKDGTHFALECTLSRCRINGRYIVTAMLRDVTERIRAEEALKRSEESFRTLIDKAPEAIAVHREGRFVYVNAALLSLLGYHAPADLVGQPVEQIVHPEDRPRVRERIARMLGTGEVAPLEEERFVRKDGSVAWAEVTAMPVEFQGEPAVVAIGRDITQRKELTARMMLMDRMIAVGTLAAGVGHEINNPLTYVTMNVNYALDRLPELRAKVDDLGHTLAGLEAGAGGGRAASAAAEVREALAEVEEALGEAQEGCYRVRDIVRDLKLFSRGSEDVRRRLDVHRVLGPAIDMAYNEIRHRARLVKEFGEVRPVVGNESRLGQVFLNLLVNAAHAIPMGKAQENEIRIRTGMRGEKVEIEIRDTGEGISESVLPSIFDPFFTTKPVGHGTGLGLSICRQIVEAHGGEIEVESQPGEGSAFRVLLPASDEALPEPEEAPERAPEAAEPKRRVLVIDDEVGIVKGLQRVLGGAYEVTGVTSAGEAIERLEGGAAYDLILCDLMMPDLTGMDFYRWLETKHPDLCARVVFTTGGAFTPEARAFLRSVPNPTLDKPLEPKVLVEAIRTLFSGAEEGDGSASD
ncbi:MAG: PAS domain S-box protein [Deltaproteobacteria bacterium]|nr:MAG: PAS domain S-box protein [Deltaproteobacteria bacterium]